MYDDVSPIRSNRLLVEDALWRCIEALLVDASGIAPDDRQGRNEWAARAFTAFEELGYADCELDPDGNLIFRASSKLIAETRWKRGRLRWRGYHRPNDSLSDKRGDVSVHQETSTTEPRNEQAVQPADHEARPEAGR